MSNSAAAATPVPAGGKKSKLLLIVLITMLVAGGAAGGAVWWFSKQKSADGADEAPKPVKKTPPVFVPMDVFTVNLGGVETARFAQIGMTLQVESAVVAEAIKTQMPVIRSKVLMIISSKSAEQLGSIDGKKALVEEVLGAVREPLATPGEDRGVSDVHFTAFVIQ